MLKHGTNTLIYFLLCIGMIIYSCRTKRSPVTYVPVKMDTVSVVEKKMDSIVEVKEIKPIPVRPIIPIDTLKESYEKAYRELEDMLEGRSDLNFKRAVFVVENAYFKAELNYNEFNSEIEKLSGFCEAWIRANPSINYHERDSQNFIKNMAIYEIMKDTVFYAGDKIGSYQIATVAHKPFDYDFNDFFGIKDWSKMFVSKLMKTGSGNCHSLPYLYKILSNDIGATSYISISPSHFYIKNRCKAHGWYNTELTSGTFPTDAWISASGYISIEAIRSGIFMDTLSQKQSVGLCMYDLAKGYEQQTGRFKDGFIIKCCDKVLKYHPNNVSAMILKAETIKKMYEADMKVKNVTIPSKLFSDRNSKNQYDEMQNLYVRALELGYREMPERMYIEWLTSVEAKSEKNTNQKIINTFKSKSKK